MPEKLYRTLHNVITELYDIEKSSRYIRTNNYVTLFAIMKNTKSISCNRELLLEFTAKIVLANCQPSLSFEYFFVL